MHFVRRAVVFRNQFAEVLLRQPCRVWPRLAWASKMQFRDSWRGFFFCFFFGRCSGGACGVTWRTRIDRPRGCRSERSLVHRAQTPPEVTLEHWSDPTKKRVDKNLGRTLLCGDSKCDRFFFRQNVALTRESSTFVCRSFCRHFFLLAAFRKRSLCVVF